MMLVAQVAPAAAVVAESSPAPAGPETALWAGGGLALGLALLIGLYGSGFRVSRRH